MSDEENTININYKLLYIVFCLIFTQQEQKRHLQNGKKFQQEETKFYRFRRRGVKKSPCISEKLPPKTPKYSELWWTREGSRSESLI